MLLQRKASNCVTASALAPRHPVQGLLVRGWVAGKDGDPMQWNQNVSLAPPHPPPPPQSIALTLLHSPAGSTRIMSTFVVHGAAMRVLCGAHAARHAVRTDAHMRTLINVTRCACIAGEGR